MPGTEAEEFQAKKHPDFQFNDFVKAFRVSAPTLLTLYLQIIARIGYKDVNLKEHAKFILLTQFLMKSMNMFQTR